MTSQKSYVNKDSTHSNAYKFTFYTYVQQVFRRSLLKLITHIFNFLLFMDRAGGNTTHQTIITTCIKSSKPGGGHFYLGCKWLAHKTSEHIRCALKRYHNYDL